MACICIQLRISMLRQELYVNKKNYVIILTGKYWSISQTRHVLVDKLSFICYVRSKSVDVKSFLDDKLRIVFRASLCAFSILAWQVMSTKLILFNWELAKLPNCQNYGNSKSSEAQLPFGKSGRIGKIDNLGNDNSHLFSNFNAHPHCMNR